jgi:hypothetical protein
MDAIEHDIATFESLVPRGDEASMVLKAQLILEESLWKFLLARLPADLVASFRGENSPVSCGKALIQLAQAVASRDEIPISNDSVVWDALYKVNSLRNKLAHELEPQRKKVVTLMKDVCRLVLKEELSGHPSRDFYHATLLLVGYLAIDRRPMTMADVE